MHPARTFRPWTRVLFCLLLMGFLAAADVAPSVELSANPAQVDVGESLQLTVTYRWPHGFTVDPEPDPAAALQDLFVTAAPLPERSSTALEERRVYHFTVAATRSGAWLLPRLTLKAHGPKGAVSVQSPELIVQVGIDSEPPHLPAARPLLIRPPTPEQHTPAWLWAVGCGLVLAVGGGVLWFVRQRRHAQLGPNAWAIFESEVYGAKLAKDGKEAGAKISLALRRYAGAIGHFDGPGLTTREIGSVLRTLPAGRITDDEGRDLLRVLGQVDDLRWAAGEAPQALMQDLSNLATTWAATVQKRLDAEAAAKGEPVAA